RARSRRGRPRAGSASDPIPSARWAQPITWIAFGDRLPYLSPARGPRPRPRVGGDLAPRRDPRGSESRAARRRPGHRGAAAGAGGRGQRGEPRADPPRRGADRGAWGRRAAVQATEGPLLVLAGAGSGKTRVLTHRVAWLIGGCGIAPEAVLAVTFTKKAAAEMREGAEKTLGPEVAGVWIATFQATCVRLLRREIGRLGRPRSFVIYDESEAQAPPRGARPRPR